MTSLPPEKQFDYARDSIAQVLTLSTAILALSLTFAKDWASGATDGQKLLLQIGWVLFLLSVALGVVSLMVVAAVATESNPSAKDGAIRWTWGLQLAFFVLGFLLMIVFGFLVI
jgi:hypothetical protein